MNIKFLEWLELKNPPLLQVALIALLMIFLSVRFPVVDFYLPYHFWVAGIFIFMGSILSLTGALAFKKVQTTVDPRNPSRTSDLVTNGVYQYSRNPMYLGFLFVLMGFAFWVSNLSAFLLLPVFVLYMNRFQIEPEEKLMQDKFGDAYRDYTRSTRRWI